MTARTTQNSGQCELIPQTFREPVCLSSRAQPRAASKQKVATYEEFENIVLGAHLQPMEEDILALDLKKTAGSASTGRCVSHFLITLSRTLN